MPRPLKCHLFLRNVERIWGRFKELVATKTYIDSYGRKKKLTANRAVERLMREAITLDRLPTLGEMNNQQVVSFPYPWLLWRPGDPAPLPSKAVLVKSVDTGTRDYFKALCARRGKGISQALSMLMTLAIEKKKLPKGKAGEE